MSLLETAQKHGAYKEILPGEYAGPCPKCGGALRLRIWPAKNEFQCLFCTVKGGAKEIADVFGGEIQEVPAEPKQSAKDFELHTLRGRGVYFALTPEAWRRLTAEGHLVFGLKECKVLAESPYKTPPSDLLLDVKEIFPGAFIQHIGAALQTEGI